MARDEIGSVLALVSTGNQQGSGLASRLWATTALGSSTLRSGLAGILDLFFGFGDMDIDSVGRLRRGGRLRRRGRHWRPCTRHSSPWHRSCRRSPRAPTRATRLRHHCGLGFRKGKFGISGWRIARGKFGISGWRIARGKLGISGWRTARGKFGTSSLPQRPCPQRLFFHRHGWCHWTSVTLVALFRHRRWPKLGCPRRTS